MVNIICEVKEGCEIKYMFFLMYLKKKQLKSCFYSSKVLSLYFANKKPDLPSESLACKFIISLLLKLLKF